MAIGDEIKNPTVRKKIVELEKEYAKIKDETSVTGNLKATQIRNEIKNLLSKHTRRPAATADKILAGGIKVKQLLNLEDNKAKTKAFAKLLGIGYKEFKTDQEYRDAVEELTGETTKEKESEGQIIQDPETGDQTILINNEVARTKKFFTVGQHELLHGLLFETVKNNDEQAIKLGKTLEDFINKLDTKKVRSRNLKNRIEKYKAAVKRGQYDVAARYEEVLTLTSEALANNELNLKTTAWEKVVDAFRQFLRKHFSVDIEIKDAADVINFIKDYNKSFEEGVLYKSFGRLTKNQLDVQIESNPTLKRIINKVNEQKNISKKKLTDEYEQFDRDIDGNKIAAKSISN